MVDSPYRNKTWEFFMTPIMFLTAALVYIISFTAPVGYETIFSVRALSEEELEEYETMFEDDEDDY